MGAPRPPTPTCRAVCCFASSARRWRAADPRRRRGCGAPGGWRGGPGRAREADARGRGQGRAREADTGGRGQGQAGGRSSGHRAAGRGPGPGGAATSWRGQGPGSLPRDGAPSGCSQEVPRTLGSRGTLPRSTPQLCAASPPARTAVCVRVCTCVSVSVCCVIALSLGVLESGVFWRVCIYRVYMFVCVQI